MSDSLHKRLLIIEDNPTYREMLKIRLEFNGYETIIAGDGLEGLNAVRREKPDLVILDLMLPLLDGHKVCRLIKFDKRFQTTPVIILTSRDLDEDAKLAKNCGGDAFIVKTKRSEFILDVINRLLEEKKG